MKIILIRHGKDPEGYRGGWSTLGLTDEGREQARAAARYLCSSADYQIDRILSSDLPRAVETAQYISAALGLPVYTDERLREINNGDLAGMPDNEAAAKYPDLFFSNLKMDEPYPNGESPSEFYTRIRDWFSATMNAMRDLDHDLLVVTHGGVINVVYHLVEQLEWSNRHPSFPSSPCSLHVVDLETMRFEVKNKSVRM